jgi:hypothetical protein
MKNQVILIGAGEGNRTLVVSLGSFCSTIELHPRSSHSTRVPRMLANFQGAGVMRLLVNSPSLPRPGTCTAPHGQFHAHFFSPMFEYEQTPPFNGNTLMVLQENKHQLSGK